ncbi:MAG: mevalonate kinase, partial [Chloroflexota bacterium]
APGKIILFGEHAVVYGYPAIAIPVNKVKATAVIQARPGQEGIQIIAPDISLNDSLKDLPLNDAIAKAIHLTMEEVGVETPPAFGIKISSTIPLASGMGSGAAVSVVVVRAVSEFLGHPLPDGTVSKIAFEIEKIHHGTPSGIDNTVITYNQPVYFVKDQPIKIFNLKSPLTIVIGDTGSPSSTAVAVGNVRKGYEENPGKYEALFNGCAQIVKGALFAIDDFRTPVLGPLMNDNHKLLVEMGVSSPQLDQLVSAAQEAGALGAKMSGGGRGGNMIALVPPERAYKIAAALLKAGASKTIITEVRP